MNTNPSANPFPSDDEVKSMVSILNQILNIEFMGGFPLPAEDSETIHRTGMFAQCLRQARETSGWSHKQCAQFLGVKVKELKELETGHFEAAGPTLLPSYVQLLGLDSLWGHWLEANASLAAKLGLLAWKAAPRPGQWPQPKPFAVQPGAFRLTPEMRSAMQARAQVLTSLGANLVSESAGGTRRAEVWAEDPRKEPARPSIYQFKITLRDCSPAIWRRFQVANQITLAQLHEVIQLVMGWEDCHLHEFQLRKTRFGPSTDPMSGPLDNSDSFEEGDYRLCELGLRARSKLDYEYDFGDGWRHQLELEKVLPLEPGFVPVCLKGARACPPEDCGGAWGYSEKLQILDNPRDPEHLHIAEWMGEAFDAVAFDLELINRRLGSLAKYWRSTKGAEQPRKKRSTGKMRK